MLNIPKILSRFKKKNDTSAYGNISTSIFTYITPLMCFLLTFVTFLIAFGHEVLWQYFSTNYALNGLIIFTLVFTMVRLIAYNYGLYHTANFLNDLDRRSKEGNVDEKATAELLVDLEKRGNLFNTNQMAQVIERISISGALYFTDTDARLIKSKTGFRITGARAGIGFMAGILVMLGLLGTFLGLLKTIDAVGAAMASMSNIGGGSVDENMMGSFIGSLAAPLQGMGLAFSSSLFGLSGSLLIGFFNYLSGGVHDKYIENFSRWVDDRIPKFNPKEAGQKAQKAPGSDDLRTWLMGFVHLANENNKSIHSLCLAISDLTEVSAKVAKRTEHIGNDYIALHNQIGTLAQGISQLEHSNRVVVNAVASSMDTLTTQITPLTKISADTHTVLGDIKTAINQQSLQTGHLVQTIDDFSQHSETRVQAQTQALGNIQEQLRTHSQALSSLNETQKMVSTTLATTPAVHVDNSGFEALYSQTMGEHLSALRSIQSSIDHLTQKTQTLSMQQQTPLTAQAPEQAAPPSGDDEMDYGSINERLSAFKENLKAPTEHDVYDILSQTESPADGEDEDKE